MRKVGRPLKYKTESERILKRREQNRVNQQRCRFKKKVILNVTENIKLGKTYKESINIFFSQLDLDYFFTGTYNPNYMNDLFQFESLEDYKRFINDNNIDFSLTKVSKIGISSIRRYSEKYIEYLQNKQLIKKCLVFYEYGIDNRLHVHMLFATNKTKMNFKQTSEKSWLIGKCKSKQIYERENLIDYCIKEINLDDHSTKAINSLENWHFYGDYSEKTDKTDSLSIND